MKKSGLRGRGGAGFPTGVKWSFIPPTNTKPIYLICNADESEPGTFKDRYIIHQDPHQLIEGMMISCFAVKTCSSPTSTSAGSFPRRAKILEKALEEARAKNFLGKNILGTGYDLEIYVHRGAGAYICGEETGLIESLEGKRPYPRIKPPYFPAVLGLYMCPTIVNNVETLCHVKHIIAMGGAEYAKLGTPNNTGTRILCVSGDVKRPGYYEIEVGKVTMGELINDLCGGLKAGRKLKAIIPGGSSAKVLRADEKFKLKDGRELGIMDIPMDFDTMAACGSMAGSGGVIVMDDIALHELGAQQHQRLLRPRILRPVHALPRGLALDEEDQRPHRRRRRLAVRRGRAGARRQQHRRPHHLRLRRGLLLADAEFREEVPRRDEGGHKAGVRGEDRERRDRARGGGTGALTRFASNWCNW